MSEKKNNLEASWNRRKADAYEKAVNAVERLKLHSQPVNFNSVHSQSGVSKNYLYKNEKLRKMIEECREEEADRKTVWHERYDKTSKSKDVIIAAKEKRIEKLEEENHRLQKEVEHLMALIYEKP